MKNSKSTLKKTMTSIKSEDIKESFLRVTPCLLRTISFVFAFLGFIGVKINASNITMNWLLIFFSICIFFASFVPSWMGKMNNDLFYFLLVPYFLICIYLPMFIGVLIALLVKSFSINLKTEYNLFYICICFCIFVTSLLWFKRKTRIAKHTNELQCLNLIVQIGVSFLTILGIFLDYIQKIIFNDFKFYYFIILLVYLHYYLRLQYLLIKHD